MQIAVMKTIKMPRLKQFLGLNCCCWTSSVLPSSTATEEPTTRPSITFCFLGVSILSGVLVEFIVLDLEAEVSLIVMFFYLALKWVTCLASLFLVLVVVRFTAVVV